jgi:hypothetical protein
MRRAPYFFFFVEILTFFFGLGSGFSSRCAAAAAAVAGYGVCAGLRGPGPGFAWLPLLRTWPGVDQLIGRLPGGGGISGGASKQNANDRLYIYNKQPRNARNRWLSLAIMGFCCAGVDRFLDPLL